MSTRPTFSKYKIKALKKANIKAEYDALHDEYNLIHQLIAARKNAKLSQEEIAQKLDTQQPAIARLEGGAWQKATLATLMAYATAVGCQLKINLVKKRI